MSLPPLPPKIILPYHPIDDPTLVFSGRRYVPDLYRWGSGPFPGIIAWRSGGYMQGGPQQTNQPLHDLCGDPLGGLDGIGFVGLFADIRLAKNDSGKGGLPGQTTTGKWNQQELDCIQAINYLRNDPACNGTVFAFSGSGGGGLACEMAVTGACDGAVCLSGQYDASDRDTVDPYFISTVDRYFDSSDIPTLLARSPISMVDASCKPIYFSNGEHEAMPFTVFTRFKAALDGAGVVNYVSHVNIDSGGTLHSFGTYPENVDAIKAFLQALVGG